MRRPFVLPLALLIALAFPATVGAAAKTYTVKTGDDFFSPTKKTIKVNDIVKWTWVGADGKAGSTINEHTITERDGKLPKLLSSTKTSGTYKFRFKKAGKYVVVCADHPDDMIYRVTVKK
jgi:plastocyanin